MEQYSDQILTFPKAFMVFLLFVHAKSNNSRLYVLTGHSFWISESCRCKMQLLFHKLACTFLKNTEAFSVRQYHLMAIYWGVVDEFGVLLIPNMEGD